MRGPEENPERAGDFDLAGHSFVLVWDFMGRDLDLKNAELAVYARIFGFESVGKPFYESKGGTARFFGLSKRAVFDAVRRLKEKGLIEETAPCPEAGRIGSKCYRVTRAPLRDAGIIARACREDPSYEASSSHEDPSGARARRDDDPSPLPPDGSEDSSSPPMQEVHPIPRDSNKHFE